MKNSIYNIGNRTRDLPACSALSQPTAPPRAPAVWQSCYINTLVINQWAFSVNLLIQCVPLGTELGISLIILPLMRILQRLQTHTTDTHYRLQKHTTDSHYRHTLQTHTTDTHYRHTLHTHITDIHYRHTLQTHTTDTHYRLTLQTHTTHTHYRHTLQTLTTDTHYRHTLQTLTTDTHYRHTLQTHSSSFLTQRTYSCSNFVTIY